MTHTRTELTGDRGTSAVEYALLLAAIAAVIAVVVFALGLLTSDKLTTACTSWDTAAGTSNC